MANGNFTIKRRGMLRNWIGLAGAIISMGSLFAFLLLFAIDLSAHQGNPYMGILAYVVAPGFCLLGLILVGVGRWIQRRAESKAAAGGPVSALVIDFSRARDRRVLGIFALGAVVYLLLTAIGSTRTYHYTESVQFCGQACHTPMKPEFVTYLNSPHARIECSQCHVGPGAEAYVRAKINGVHQLIATINNSFDRPIKTPVKHLRPAQETCEHCHWPKKFVGNLDRTYSHFLADETNTAFSVRLLLKVGGGDAMHGPVGGIHWHMNLANKVEYIALDPLRQNIPWVRFTTADGTVKEYRTPAFKDDPSKHVIRKMDCLDCHNRPAHRFNTPNRSVDLAMASGEIDPSLPWVKSNVVAVLTQSYADEASATQKIAEQLRAKYKGAAKLESLVAATQDIYTNNFFPEMKSDWRVYPDNIGHKDWNGCFRCHDGQHKTADKKQAIKATDCNACHTILAQGNGPQFEQLNPKGHKFYHLDAVNEDFSCNNCHTGGKPKE